MTTETAESAASSMADSGREPLILRHPNPTDGRELWQLTADSGVLDLNSAYAYVLWADDFAATSVVALRGRRCVGFITGYRRPQHLSTLMVWQVAVSAAERGSGVATAMLDWLVAAVAHPSERLTVEATVSPSNTASRAFFTGFARRAGVALHDVPGFDAHLFPAAHEPEPRVRIGPLPVRP